MIFALLCLGLLIIVCWSLGRASTWLLMRILPSSQMLRDMEVEAETAYIKHLIAHHAFHTKIGNICEADQIAAELRERRIEGWYRPASTKNTDTEN